VFAALSHSTRQSTAKSSHKAHPEQSGDGLQVTYDVISFDFGELIENQGIYFPKFVLVKILEKKSSINASS